MIAICNYGIGNVQALANIYKRLNVPAKIAGTPRELAGAEKIILPGVGAFDWAMTRFNNSGMRDALENLVMRQGAAVLGICVGMQMLAKRSEEGKLAGLGWIDAEVKKFDGKASLERSRLPHMGWNDVEPSNEDGLFRNIGAAGKFYFLHSYYVVPKDTDVIFAVTNYGGCFASSVRAGHIYGVQFHPEKSHQWGVQLLKNFAGL